MDRKRNLEAFEIYDQVENVPEVEVTLNKVLDGTPTLYFMCMGGPNGIVGSEFSGVSGKELVDLVNNRVNFRLGVYPDTVSAATGNASFYVD